jgi:AcrR family transcriptional regulator
MSSPPKPKGLQTRIDIVDAALRLASQMGLEGLSMGALAEMMGMSKSGVFAHFGSREELQISVIKEYFSRFEQTVFYPAMQATRGVPRLKVLFDNWMAQVLQEAHSGCIFIGGAVEFDERPGAVRDALAQAVTTWLKALRRAVQLGIDLQHLKADTDAKQVVFELHGLILALHYEARFFKSPNSIHRARLGFERVMATYRFSSSPLQSLGAPMH